MLFLLISVCFASELNYAVLFGNTETLGYYYADIWIGTPRVLQTVIIDTGSRITAFPCSDCSSCGNHMDKYFDYKNSSSSRLITCSEGIQCADCSEDSCWYSQNYAEGSSIEGVLIEDRLFLGDNFKTLSEVTAVIGCHRKETRQFRSQLVDGIMGLGYSKSGIPTVVDLLQQLAPNNTDDIFALCMGSEGGFMTVGGYNESAHTEAVQWASLHQSTFYSVRVGGIKVNGKAIDWDTEETSPYYKLETIIDSGTTFTYIHGGTLSRVLSSLKSHCRGAGNCRGKRVSVSLEPNECYEYREEGSGSRRMFFRSFPVIEFAIGEVGVK